MLQATLHVLPVFAAAKSKVPFFIAGGLLAVWAVVISTLVGLRRPNFPGSQGGQRAVIGVSALLVFAAMFSAVATSGLPNTASSEASVTTTGPNGSSSAPARPQSQSKATSINADPTGLLKFDKTSLSVKSGTVSFNFTNRSPVPHNFTIALGSKVIGHTPTFDGGTRSLTVNLPPGKYAFYCSVPGHRAAGMNGTLTVSS